MSTTLLGLFEEALAADDWSFEDISDASGMSALRLRFQGTTGAWVALVRTHEDAAQVLVYSVAPTPAPEERRAAVAEMVTRINYGLRIGNFEMDFSDGEVRYKTSIDVEGGELTKKMAMTLLTMNLSTMDTYLAGIYQVFNGADPQATVSAIEDGH